MTHHHGPHSNQPLPAPFPCVAGVYWPGIQLVQSVAAIILQLGAMYILVHQGTSDLYTVMPCAFSSRDAECWR